ncbi:hypothetical protein PAEPH01_2323 [Pancytospora epiphaga]|nr:hypothetical protein PAEPH01_2323 [Pancytospora epiphaga]
MGDESRRAYYRLPYSALKDCSRPVGLVKINLFLDVQDRLVTVETEKMHKYNCKKACAGIRVQNADHTICDDMGRSGNKVLQKALEGHRDNQVLHPDDRVQEDAGEHILRISTRRRAPRRDRGQASPEQRAGTRGRSSSLPGTN